MRKFNTKRNEEINMKNEMRILTYENNKYRNCSARRRWKDEFD
ncbi:tetracycline resistance protein tetM [Bacillus cereus]|uniref:Tetracycline resistance protein tetM n=1 Tax=Bacillus cereus TaxID=1396 RepID=A0AA44QBH3_BACCE|nr:tetracycline resistance protein tetM [Bacillus cereus]PFN07279.1 tetracycline resistance protein tetM [Bacillus cereus]PFO78046.1 tetracycline resistance protein tetM [Bacillus cereus]PFR27440.1 tetracycline resistance protein tetM [Bacillus cereus]PFS01386.1 tetracycline resistance protein tetM [Bacillus cereus]